MGKTRKTAKQGAACPNPSGMRRKESKKENVFIRGYSIAHSSWDSPPPVGYTFFLDKVEPPIFCCELILVWWHVHVSDLPSSPLVACIRSSVSIICTISLPPSHVKMNSFVRCTYPCAPLVHALDSLLRRITLIPCISYIYTRFIYAPHIPMLRDVVLSFTVWL